jgi:AcrR family transcriptional regulator
MTVPVKRLRGQHHGDLRNALLAAALELVAERGPRGFSVAEAARRAGVSSAAPYKHFADRDALLAALAVRGYEQQVQRFTAALAAAPDGPVDRLAAVVRAYVAFAVEERPLFDVVFGAGLDKAEHPDVGAASAAVLALLLSETAALAPGVDEAQELLMAVASLAHGYAVFLTERAFGPVDEALAPTLDRAEGAARALLAGHSPSRSPSSSR